ncbi:unnamed protein product [Debaryomyces fabryi]|nr:unnamed protein product [Debaryomyces fabryi]CUM48912.1 unnamed protein product [Debaryomyces tyrocola]CUM48481.1 unnamed protein product [Debaryomyces fabryi]CUM51769.1 unnamed protein product [Debaryomyces tyrocola]CUM52327.1 unnamed protein product [Debaryomyces tyrocola]
MRGSNSRGQLSSRS